MLGLLPSPRLLSSLASPLPLGLSWAALPPPPATREQRAFVDDATSWSEREPVPLTDASADVDVSVFSGSGVPTRRAGGAEEEDDDDDEGRREGGEAFGDDDDDGGGGTADARTNPDEGTTTLELDWD